MQESFHGRDFFFSVSKGGYHLSQAPPPPNLTQRVGKGGPGVDIVSRETDFYSEQLEKYMGNFTMYLKSSYHNLDMILHMNPCNKNWLGLLCVFLL